MKEAHTIFGLFIVLVIILSMGVQFKDRTQIKEGFHNTFYTGSELDYKPITKIKDGDTNGAERYPGSGYLGVANPPKTIAVPNWFDGLPIHW